MSLTLHGYWRSSASYRVRIALNLKQLDYEYVPVHLVNNGGEQKSDAYQRLNPSKLVPTFVDSDADITLSQSLAIIEYLDEKYPEPCLLMPKHAQDRARVRMLAYDMACDTQPLANLRVLNRLKSDFDADDAAVKAWVQHWVTEGFNGLSKKIETRAGKYAYGYQVSLADICIVPQVYNALRFGVDMTAFPLIHKIYKNCTSLDAFAQAAPENQPDAV
ncbi:maleylacetoacetate isomerase [Glaciecola siphonariae]|uniref:Maleylacetoacetate isomerase n=1 Tax=Glaciecola siphonariae TaxID=521012 RepID=A0ABV9LWN0_9ALTE